MGIEVAMETHSRLRTADVALTSILGRFASLTTSSGALFSAGQGREGEERGQVRGGV